jgi:hypothetical protein
MASQIRIAPDFDVLPDDIAKALGVRGAYRLRFHWRKYRLHKRGQPLGDLAEREPRQTQTPPRAKLPCFRGTIAIPLIIQLVAQVLAEKLILQTAVAAYGGFIRLVR